MNATATTEYGTLCDYKTGADLRPATAAELAASLAAAEDDGGAGVILVDGARCYVSGGGLEAPVDAAD